MRRWSLTEVLVFSVGKVSATVLLALSLLGQGWCQSRDPRNPSPWNSYGVNGVGDGGDSTYYYRLTVDPGEVTVHVQAQARALSTGVTVDLLDASGNPVGRGGVIATSDRGREEQTRVSMREHQSLLMAIHTDANTGNYSVWIDGPVARTASVAPPRRVPVIANPADHVNPEALRRASLPTIAPVHWEMAGSGDDGVHDYYYPVVAHPGDIQITTQCQARRFSTAVTATLEDASGVAVRQVGSIATSATPVRETGTYANSSRQNLRLHVRVEANCGAYQVVVDGPVEH